MFDKLIESNTQAAEFKDRKGYFVVSSVVVGLVFLAAVVASIYAGEISIGNADLELSELLSPIEMAAVEPEQPQPHLAQTSNSQTTQTTRHENLARVDEAQFVPPAISTTPNTGRSRPNFDFQLNPGPEKNAGSTIGTGRDLNGSVGGPGLSKPDLEIAETKPDKDLPPAIVTPKPVTRSIGVVNGIAKDLPKPAYPATALALNIQGKVDVQVTIDETGKVISARAASGHPLLRQSAERAAWNAKFTPTLLSKVPVKVTGVIVYNFTRN